MYDLISILKILNCIEFYSEYMLHQLRSHIVPNFIIMVTNFFTMKLNNLNCSVQFKLAIYTAAELVHLLFRFHEIKIVNRSSE